MTASNTQVRIISLPKISDPRGSLTFIEGNSHIPFEIKRVFWIYDVPGGETRGGHAYRTQEEFIVALSGSFDVVVHDKKIRTVYNLNRSYLGLYILGGYWRHMENFSTNSVAMVLSSMEFDEQDYVRNFDEYIGV
mgnify:CR=1 FL=1